MPQKINSKTEKITFGPVHLKVTDTASTTKFWTELMGLKLRAKKDGIALGTDTQTLVVLHQDATHPVRPGYSGLYHFAIHIPTQAEFARTLARLLESGWSIAPTDHIMSKAIYLTDPDGITIEITHETPDRFERYDMQTGKFQVIASDGSVHGATEALDVKQVLEHLADKEIFRPITNDAFIGHLHFYVPHLQESYDFYKQVGFEENLITTQLGFADLSAGGVFKHRLAMNTWQGQGVPPAPPNMAGLKKAVIKIDEQKVQTTSNESLDLAGNTLDFKTS